MKNSEIKKRKRKYKNYENIKWIKLAKNMCVVIVFLFLLYVFGISMLVDINFSQVIVDYPVVAIGFVISAANLFIWYILKKLLDGMLEQQETAGVQLFLSVLTIAQILLLNVIVAGLLFVGVFTSFRWSKFSLKSAFTQLETEGQMKVFIGTVLLLIVFIFLTFLISINVM
ncbi:MAG: hypothetical protein ACK5KR_00965 [Breznakia sp.]